MGNEVKAVKVLRDRVVTLTFHGTVAANSNVTLVSKRITFPFITEEFVAHFALNTNKQLRAEWFISPDDSAPTSKPISGTSVLGQLGQVAYVVGDDETVTIPYRVRILEMGMYIKLFLENLDSYEHSIDGHATLECEPEEGF